MFSYTYLFLVVGTLLVGFVFMELVALFSGFLDRYVRTSNRRIVSECNPFVCACFLLLCAGVLLLCLSQNEGWLRKDLSYHKNRIEELEHEKKIIEQKINDFEGRTLNSVELYEYSALRELNNEISRKAGKHLKESKVLERNIVEKNVKKIKKQLKEETLK